MSGPVSGSQRAAAQPSSQSQPPMSHPYMPRPQQAGQPAAAVADSSSCCDWGKEFFSVQLAVIANFVKENPVIALVSMVALVLLGFSPLLPSIVITIFFSLSCFGAVGLLAYYLFSQGQEILQQQAVRGVNAIVGSVLPQAPAGLAPARQSQGQGQAATPAPQPQEQQFRSAAADPIYRDARPEGTYPASAGADNGQQSGFAVAGKPAGDL